jgi:hypothetical protein
MMGHIRSKKKAEDGARGRAIIAGFGRSMQENLKSR